MGLLEFELSEYFFGERYEDFYILLRTVGKKDGEGFTILVRESLKSFWDDSRVFVAAKNKSLEEAEDDHERWARKLRNDFLEVVAEVFK